MRSHPFLEVLLENITGWAAPTVITWPLIVSVNAVRPGPGPGSGVWDQGLGPGTGTSDWDQGLGPGPGSGTGTRLLFVDFNGSGVFSRL